MPDAVFEKVKKETENEITNVKVEVNVPVINQTNNNNNNNNTTKRGRLSHR
jgi:hypothetical protein